MSQYLQLIKAKTDSASYDKLVSLNNKEVMDFVGYAIELCKPESVWVGNDSAEDVAYCRQLAIDNKEERPLSLTGHTVHFDGYYDQARKKEVTKYLVPANDVLDPKLNQIEREKGLAEIEGLQKDAYTGRQMLVRFFASDRSTRFSRFLVSRSLTLHMLATVKIYCTVRATQSLSVKARQLNLNSLSFVT